MSSEFAVVAESLGKTYHLFDRPTDRLKQMLLPHRKYYRDFHALSNISFSLPKGEVLGLVGRNGAGKSTLLQLICGTLNPSKGNISVHGRVAALLELGAGFNPEFSGRENIYLYASVLGLSQNEISERYESIVEFSGIRDFIEQPVKTYSSGMYVRLAFSIATSIDPDILIVDEALSVGDGAFARKSFDRIMTLREQGTTILFCSHMMFQIETLCTRALWLEHGRVLMDGPPAKVVVAYQSALAETAIEEIELNKAAQTPVSNVEGYARLESVVVSCDGKVGRKLTAISGQSTVSVMINFVSDASMPPPTVAVTIHGLDGGTLASTSTLLDKIPVIRNSSGAGWAEVKFKNFPLLKGTYNVSGHLLCERSLHLYETAAFAALVDVEQEHHEQGVFSISRQWDSDAASNVVKSTEQSATNQDFFSWLSKESHELAVGGVLMPPSDNLGNDFSEALLLRFGFQHDVKSTGWIRNQIPTWTPEWFPTSRSFEWLALFESTFGYATSNKFFHWKYRDAVHPGVGLRNTEGQLVAFYGGMPRPILYFGTPNTAVQVGDVMVHPASQGVLSRNGPFMRSARTYIERSIGEDRPYLLGFGFPEVRAMRLAEKQNLYVCVDEIHELSWPALGVGINWQMTTRALHTDLTVLDQLWSQMAPHFSDAIIGVRDAAWFESRYCQHPNVDYSIWLVSQRWNRQPVAAFVLRDRENALEIIDIVAEPQNFAVAVNAARKHAERLGKSTVTAWLTKSQLSLWQSTQPQSTDTGIRIPLSIITPGPQPEDVMSRWWLMGGDTDFR